MTQTAETTQETNPTEWTRKQAKNLLRLYFALQSTAMTDNLMVMAIDHGEYDAHDHNQIGRVLAQGCQNLAFIIRTGDINFLRHDCQWLYNEVGHLRYPACWDETPYEFRQQIWQEFWNAVAQTLDKAPKYGTPHGNPRPTKNEAMSKLLKYAERHGLTTKRPWFCALTGKSGVLVHAPAEHI